MLIIPAIDILDGKCVRLKQGDYKQSKIYNNNPLKVAKNFLKAGVSLIHVVDLNGAKEGKPKNSKLIFKLAALANIQVGGGIRDFKTAEKYLKNGAKRIILGSSVITNPKLMKDVINNFGSDRIAIALDIKKGKLALNGWQTDSKKPLNKITEQLKKLGIKFVIVTDISRDGMLSGPNFKLIKKYCEQGFKVIASGGISSMEDLKNLEKLGVYGAIVGKAIYEGKIKLTDSSKFTPKSNLAKRIIPCMDIADGRVVKGIGFKNLKDVGDPVELGKYYSDCGADELVFLDINASFENRKTLYELVTKIAEKINIPFTVGGGIKTVNDIKTLLKSGADKVAISTSSVLNPLLIKKAAKQFGSQCIVISLDCKKDRITGYNGKENWEIYIKGGRQKTNIDAVKFAKKMEKLGAGELLVNSLDCDGERKGYDIELLKNIVQAVEIPVIASSGANFEKDFLDAFKLANVDAALAASIFHSKEKNIYQIKKYLSKNNVKIRI